jgi:5-methylcytosine-specific restriction endonuclease McrA
MKVIKSNISMNLEYMRNYMRERRKARRDKFIKLLGGKCVQCGSVDNLEFDHRNPKYKKYDYNNLKDSAEKTILKELKKCVLLCANCHLQKTKDNKEHINKDKKPARHGTIWMYKRYKCRCSKCKKAMSDYFKNQNS